MILTYKERRVLYGVKVLMPFRAFDDSDGPDYRILRDRNLRRLNALPGIR